MIKSVLLMFCLGGCLLLNAQSVVINEIHFEPPEKIYPEEFIELYNPGDAVIDLAGWYFSDGVTYRFPQGSRILPEGYLVVAQSPDALESRFGAILNVLGPYEGGLSNEGERVTLRDPAGNIIDTVNYDFGFPWPTATTGQGSSMELIHPDLDNNLGGSWRASGLVGTGGNTRQYFVQPTDTGWRYRKGTSNPPAGWLDVGHAEDGSWTTAQTSIGFGDGDDNTLITDMGNNYSSIYLRHTFTIGDPAQLDGPVTLGVYVDDGAIVWINGHEVARRHVDEGDIQHDDLAQSHEAEWEPIPLPSPASVLTLGENVICVHALNASLSSSDFSIDASLYVPAADELDDSTATPGKVNSVYSQYVPPIIRQVRHALDTPASGEPNVVTAKITDPDGVAQVTLSYQVVLPGHYVPAHLPLTLSQLLQDPEQPHQDNPEYTNPANWTSLSMHNDGVGPDASADDYVFSCAIPGQINRAIVRYRIDAVDKAGSRVNVPYHDDPVRNFAYFIYDGVPDYRVQTSINGQATVYPSEQLTLLPVYVLITRNEDFMSAVAPATSQQIPQGTQARFSFNWEGAIYHDGVLYDHVRYRLRGANGRYQVPPGNPSNVAGKRLWRFRFNKGHRLQTYDHTGKPYARKWKMLNTGRMFGNRLDGNWGLSELVNYRIWNDYRVPAPEGHMFHWRVVDGVQEAPAGASGQYHGDFWGMARAFENYDAQFLENHGMPKGNLYKLVNQTTDALAQLRYQAPGAVADGSDHDNIEDRLRSVRSGAWLTAHVNYDAWYRYHAICQAVRHYDFWASANKNAAWYFEPDYTAANGYLGRMWTFPWDTDGTWGPTWNAGVDRPYDAIYGGGGKPDFQKAYRAHIREIRDLLWQRDQLEPLIRQTAAYIDPMEEADIDRFRNAPSDACRQYFSSSRERTLEGKIQDMLNFAFVGGSWPGGSIGAGGRADDLDDLADNPDRNYLPERPTVSYEGVAGYPMDGLLFRASDFSDPQGAGTFQAMKWRIARVTSIPNPGSIPLDDPFWRETPVHLEMKAAWESQDLFQMNPELTIPVRYVEAGVRYRVRVRMQDDDDYWSHWSDPVEFTAGPPAGTIPEVDGLRITEMMYNPAGGIDEEFIELQNRGGQTLDLWNVWFSDGIDFDFRESPVRFLGPGEIIVLVKDIDVFESRYDAAGITIAGEYSLRQENAGERITLTYGGNLPILDFVYDPLWYPETDGLGYSLNVADINAAPEAWNNPDNWFSSSRLMGTPGAVDEGVQDTGLLRPGDANADGAVDLSDAVSLLIHLFSGSAVALPCEGGSISEGGNLTLLDFNGDESVNLADAIGMLDYLFDRGDAHQGGAFCKRIPGCPNVCAPLE